jgi:plastocyanin
MKIRLGLAVACVALAACTPVDAASASQVTLREFAIEVDAAEIDPGGTLQVANVGEFGHTLVISDSSGAVVAATDLIAAGESLPIEADWAPGTYSLTCRIVVEAEPGVLVDHYAEGMQATLSVAG